MPFVWSRQLTAMALLACALACHGMGVAQAARPVGPFTFVYGLERGGGFPALHDLGLNTLYLDLLPADLADLDQVRALVRGASAQGWHVIIGLPTTEAVSGNVGPRDERYLGSVGEMIACAVGGLRGEQGVTAWGTGHSLERTLKYTNEDFRAYLQLGYPSLEALNTSWGASLPTWQQISMDTPKEVDAAMAHGVGRATVDLADYQAWAYRETMKRWLEAIRALDPDRPVLTGRVTLYRSLVAIPEGYDVVCVSMPPEVVEPDLYTHNVQALDIARRGGKFQVLQVLRCPSLSSEAYITDLARGWAQLAALHGSVGVAIEDWDLVGSVYAMEQRHPTVRRKLLTETLRDLRRVPFGVSPRANVAVLYEPYAAGREVTGQPLYGYVGGLLPGEPADLAYALRLGASSGPVDYLALSDLSEADLNRYGVILAPTCLRLPPAESAVLSEYVDAGGALVADLGLGMYEARSWAALPEPWLRVFGLGSVGNLADHAGNFRVGMPVPELPGLEVGMMSRGSYGEARRPGATAASDRRTFTVVGPSTEARVSEGGVAFAPIASRLDDQKKPAFRGLFAHRWGGGLAIFASHALWQHWPLEDPLSSLLHSRLFARRARFALAQPGLLQSQLHFTPAEQEGLLLNLGRGAVTAEVMAYVAEGRAYAGAASQFTAAPTRLGLAPGTARLLAFVPARGLTRFARSGLLVQPAEGEATVSLDEYRATGVKFTVAGPGALVQARANRGLEIISAEATDIRLILGDGVYPVAPGSRHRARMSVRGRGVKDMTLTADPAGELDLSGSYRLATIHLEPAADPG